MKKTTLIGAAAMLFTAGIASAQNVDFVNGFNYHELLKTDFVNCTTYNAKII